MAKKEQQDITKDPAYSSIQDALKYAAKAANLLDACDTQLEIAFLRQPNWNDEIRWTLHEVQQKLCPVLGALVTWWDDDEDPKD